MLVIVHGDNQYATWQKLLELTAGSVRWIDGSSLDNLDAIFEAADSYSLMDDEPERVVVKRIFKNRKRSLVTQLADLLKERESIPDMVLWESGKVDKRSKLYKFAKSSGEVHEYTLPKPNELRSWLRRELSEKNIKATSTQIEQIIEKAGVDQLLLTGEIEKLRLLLKAEGREDLTDEDLRLVSMSAKEGDIWAMLDAISERDRPRLLRLASDLLQNPNEFPILIGSITKQLKLLYLLLDPDISESEITGKLGVHPFPVSKAKKFAHRFDLLHIKILFEKLLHLDSAIKEGKIEPRLGINLFLASI
ncbi:MAG: DNA polymerase III subunit delta [Candidatus Dojkabacteria bacterium]